LLSTLACETITNRRFVAAVIHLIAAGMTSVFHVSPSLVKTR